MEIQHVMLKENGFVRERRKRENGDFVHAKEVFSLSTGLQVLVEYLEHESGRASVRFMRIDNGKVKILGPDGVIEAAANAIGYAHRIAQ